MLVQFTVGNFLSFNEKKSLEMFASKQTNLQEQLYEPGKRYLPRILKAAIIFGPNASGKSNLIKAFDYAVSFVLNKPSTLKNRELYFKLNPECFSLPSYFEFDILVEKHIYRFGFTIKDTEVQEEWLYETLSTGERLVYRREYKADKKEKNTIKYGNKYIDYESDKQLNLILSITPADRLFLYEIVQRNRDDFKKVYDWFNKVVVIYPRTGFRIDDKDIANERLLELYRVLLKKSDIGIEDLYIREINMVSELRMHGNYSDGINNNNADLVIKRKTPDGKRDVEFTLDEESDGTNRLFDLIPILNLVVNDSIVLIDELDRSLHSLLLKFFLQEYFMANKNHKSQLIATTHDVSLLDVDLLRRDCIWFIKKNFEMASTLYSLVEYETVRNDKVLNKAYLSGLYGAVPIIDKGGE